MGVPHLSQQEPRLPYSAQRRSLTQTEMRPTLDSEDIVEART